MKPVHLLHTENEHRIQKSTDPDFLFTLQLGLLAELKERGFLNESQYLDAAEHLREQFRHRREEKR